MTFSELKFNHELYNAGSSYFSKETMRFFSDTIANYGVLTHDDRRQSGYERLVYQSFKQSVQQAFHIDVDRNAWVFDQNQLKTRSDGKESLKCLCETFYLNTESLFLTGQL